MSEFGPIFTSENSSDLPAGIQWTSDANVVPTYMQVHNITPHELVGMGTDFPVASASRGENVAPMAYPGVKTPGQSRDL